MRPSGDVLGRSSLENIWESVYYFPAVARAVASAMQVGRYLGHHARTDSRLKKKSQAGRQGRWQLESLAKECLEQVKSCEDTDCTQRMVKQGFIALKSGDWEESNVFFRVEVKAAECAFDWITELLI